MIQRANDSPQRRRQERQRAAGKCRSCGRPRAPWSCAYCAECLEKMRERWVRCYSPTRAQMEDKEVAQ